MKDEREIEKGNEKANKNEKHREKFSDIDLKVEAYAEGDYRLLRYLPDGSCVFEQIPDEENKNMKNLQQYAQLFCSAMEKTIQIKSNDENLRNNKEWTQGEEYRVMVENDLKEFMVLFDLMLGTLNYDKGTKYLTLNKCHYVRDIKANKQDICIAVTTRKELLHKLRKLCEETRKQIKSINGIAAQKYFLHFINQLLQYWKVLNKKYFEIDYLQLDNNFPYVTEVSVEYFFLPSYFWNFSSNPIFLSWPPYPSFSPFKSHYAHVTFSLDGLEKDIKEGIHNQTRGCAIGDSLFRHKPTKRQGTTHEMVPPLSKEYKIYDPTEGIQNGHSSYKPNGGIPNGGILNEDHTPINDEHKTTEQSYTFYCPNVKEEEINIFNMLDSMSIISVEFEGIAAHLIENNYAIQFDLCPLNVQLKNELKMHTKKNSVWRGNTFPERIIPENIFFEQGKKMHAKLTTAQWVLIDKSIFYILAEQANNLKDRNNNLALNLPSVTGKRKKIKIHCTDINHKCLEFLISDVLIPSIGKKSIPVDFCFAVMYEPTEGVHSKLAERSANGDAGDTGDDAHGDDFLGRAQVNGGGRNGEVALDYELVQLFLHLSLAKIRDLFICSWKYFSFEMPYYSADIHPLIYQNVFPDPRSGSLITSFFSWFIVSMEKYLRASGGTPVG